MWPEDTSPLLPDTCIECFLSINDDPGEFIEDPVFRISEFEE